jgi:ribosomal protein L11
MKQIISAGEASREGPLGVILSQFHISFTDFCPDFNKKTAQWTPGVLLPTKVVKALRAKEYKLYISSPSVPFLIDSAIDEDTGKIDNISLFDAIRFHSQQLNRPLKPIANLFFSSLHAKHIRRIKIK